MPTVSTFKSAKHRWLFSEMSRLNSRSISTSVVDYSSAWIESAATLRLNSQFQWPRTKLALPLPVLRSPLKISAVQSTIQLWLPLLLGSILWWIKLSWSLAVRWKLVGLPPAWNLLLHPSLYSFLNLHLLSGQLLVEQDPRLLWISIVNLSSRSSKPSSAHLNWDPVHWSMLPSP